jgi:hypothetical protein
VEDTDELFLGFDNPRFDRSCILREIPRQ